MKLVALTSAALLAATTAFAGSLNTESTGEASVDVVESNENAGGSGAWLIPAIAIALVVAAVVASQDDEDE